MYCRDKYRLELHWDKLEYHNDATVMLHGAYFSGPALRDAQKLSEKDSIDMDLTPQHLVVLKSYYILKLSWESVRYQSNGSVLLGKATIVNDQLKTLHKLEDKDFIVINTEKHEHTTHARYMSYEAEVTRNDNKPYVYTK